MKKTFTKIISLALALILCFSMAITCFAAKEETNERDCPQIYIHGFMSKDVYTDVDDPDSETAWPVSQNSILTAVSKILIPLAKLTLTKDLEKFGEEIAVIVDELFAPVCLGFSGEIENNSGIRFEYPEKEDVQKGEEYQFGYDWRLSPVETAKELDKFVDYILENSGSDKVTFECHSLGGIIALTYFKLYGTDKVKSVALDSTAIYGENYTGELLKGDINLKDDGVRYYLDFIFDGMDLDTFLSLLIGSITDIGVMNYVCEHLNDIVDVLLGKVEFSLMKLFANWPTIWAMVPDEMLKEAKENVFGRIYTDKNIDFSSLLKKIESYDTLVRSNRENVLKDMNKNMNLYVISRYGYSSLPLTESWQDISDGVIDVKHNSFGATAAKFGETLNVEETAYLSPDRTIDASTCLFPEQTWFIKNLKHTDGTEKKNEMIKALLYYDGQATIDTFEEYPRFMEYNSKYDYLIADEGNDLIANIKRLIIIIKQIVLNLSSDFTK